MEDVEYSVNSGMTGRGGGEKTCWDVTTFRGGET